MSEGQKVKCDLTGTSCPGFNDTVVEITAGVAVTWRTDWGDGPLLRGSPPWLLAGGHISSPVVLGTHVGLSIDLLHTIAGSAQSKWFKREQGPRESSQPHCLLRASSWICRLSLLLYLLVRRKSLNPANTNWEKKQTPPERNSIKDFWTDH